jgi:uncharacterized membrane protein
MSYFWIAVVFFHVLAAVSWIGGMIFLSVVLAPLMRRGAATSDQLLLFRTAAKRFRILTWSSIAVLIATGPLLLTHRSSEPVAASLWGGVLALKVFLVACLLVLTVLHDVFLGPRMSRLGGIPRESRTTREQALLMTSRWLPRLALLVACSVLAAAVILARA